MGQRDRFSYYDIEKLNLMYECKRKPGYGSTGIVSTAQHLPIKRPNNNHNFRPIQSVHSLGTSTADGRKDRNILGEIFKAYTSPQFWQKLFSAWLYSQPQSRYHQHQFNSDSPYFYNYPYVHDQSYYG